MFQLLQGLVFVWLSILVLGAFYLAGERRR